MTAQYFIIFTHLDCVDVHMITMERQESILTSKMNGRSMRSGSDAMRFILGRYLNPVLMDMIQPIIGW